MEPRSTSLKQEPDDKASRRASIKPRRGSVYTKLSTGEILIIEPKVEYNLHYITHHPISKRLLVLYEDAPLQFYLSFLLIISLFISSAWILGNAPSSSDDILYGILMWIFVTFCIESFTLCFIMPEYFNSFFFWFDVIGTLSIILDIDWISESFMPDDNNAHQKGSILRAARAAKLGARYGRIMRLLKFVKVLNNMPCYKKKEEVQAEPTLSAVRKTSARLSEVLSRRVASLVMLLVIVIPFLNYQTTDSSIYAWADNFKMLGKNASAYSASDIENSISEFHSYYLGKDLRAMSVSMSAPQGNFYEQFSYHNVRNSNIIEYRSDYNSLYPAGSLVEGDTYYQYKLTLRLNGQIPNQWNALFSILLIILVIFVLLYFTASFNAAVEELIVVPLEKMMNILRKSATDMLKSMQVMDKQVSEENRVLDDDEDLDEELETAVLEKMVEKCKLLVA
jgi:hypothetical protein